MGQARPGGGIGLLISPTGSSPPDPLEAATKQFHANTPQPSPLTVTKAPNKRRFWLAAPAPLQYARADNRCPVPCTSHKTEGICDLSLARPPWPKARASLVLGERLTNCTVNGIAGFRRLVAGGPSAGRAELKLPSKG